MRTAFPTDLTDQEKAELEALRAEKEAERAEAEAAFKEKYPALAARREAEKAEAEQRRAEQQSARFKELDANGDGKLSVDEFKLPEPLGPQGRGRHHGHRGLRQPSPGETAPAPATAQGTPEPTQPATLEEALAQTDVADPAPVDVAIPSGMGGPADAAPTELSAGEATTATGSGVLGFFASLLSRVKGFFASLFGG